LEGLGLLKAVLTRTQQSEPEPFIFSFLAGAGNDEKVFDVRCPVSPSYVYLVTKSFVQYNESSGGGRNSEGLGIYR